MVMTGTSLNFIPCPPIQGSPLESGQYGGDSLPYWQGIFKTKSFLPVTGFHGHELLILVKMQTAGRISFSHFVKILMSFFRL